MNERLNGLIESGGRGGAFLLRSGRKPFFSTLYSLMQDVANQVLGNSLILIERHEQMYGEMVICLKKNVLL